MVTGHQSDVAEELSFGAAGRHIDFLRRLDTGYYRSAKKFRAVSGKEAKLFLRLSKRFGIIPRRLIALGVSAGFSRSLVETGCVEIN